MKQLLQNLKSGETRVVDVPVPVVKPGFLLVRNRASLVSAGTERMLVEFAEKNLVEKARSRPDLVKQVITKARKEGILATVEAAFNRLDQPMPLGYSSAGEVLEVGSGVTGFSPGDRVACAGGGFAIHAEYVLVPQNLVARIPANLSYEEASFATLGAIALHGFRLAAPQVGERIAIIGLGLLGLLAAKIAKAAGCQVFGIDLSSARVDLANQLGFQAVLRAGCEAAGADFTSGAGFDHVLICADAKSNDPVELAASLARDRANVVSIGAVGLDIPRKPYYEKELNFIVSRSYGPGRYDARYEEQGVDYPAGYVRWTEGRNLQAIINLMANGQMDVKPLISHRFLIDQAPAAYELITGKSGEPFLAVVLTYPSADNEQINRTVYLNTHPVSEQIQVGILGAGNYANATFLPILEQTGGIAKVGIASAAGAHAQVAASKYGFKYATSETEKILKDPEINTVVILTRHHLHTPQTLAAFEQGKHVYCEKPPAINLDQLQQLSEALSAPAHPAYMVGYNRRYAPLAIRLKESFGYSSHPMVMTYRVNAGSLPLTHWTQDPLVGGGRIIGEGCHFIDWMTWLCGSLPVEGVFRSLPNTDRSQDDVVSLTLTFANGSIGTLHYLANGDSALAKEYIEVFQAGNTAILRDFRQLEIWKNGSHSTSSGGLRQDKGHRNAWSAFLESIRTGKTAISAEEILQPAEITIRLVENLRQGILEPVRLVNGK